MPIRDDGIRSLRCCKRRSVVSNLRGFGNKWNASRLRIAILHPPPIRSNPNSTYRKSPTSSDIALAAVAGLSLQGHSVTLYTSGYRQKDVPDYVWETSGDVKSCLPRIFRLALFPKNSRPLPILNFVVSLLVCVRLLMNCAVTYLINSIWTLIPLIFRRLRGGSATMTQTGSVLDVVITFGNDLIPQILLSRLADEICHFPLDLEYVDMVSDNWLLGKVFNLSRTTLLLATNDYDCVKWGSLFPDTRVLTIYSPVVSIPSSPLTPRASSSERYRLQSLQSPDLVEIESKLRSIVESSRPYFIALSWYHVFQDVVMAMEAFAAFLAFHAPAPGEISEPEDFDGCTGSARVLNLPRLIIVGVEMDNYLLILREINRLKLIEGDDVIVLSSSIPESIVSDLFDKSIGLIHTPSEINETRIPCAAMLAARPVITTVAFSHSEPVRHEATGILVKSSSPQLVAQAIDQLYNLCVSRPNEWIRMGQRGRQRVVTEFSIEMFGSRLDDILEIKRSSGIKLSSSTGVGSSPSLRPASVIRRISSSIHQNLNELE